MSSPNTEEAEVAYSSVTGLSTLDKFLPLWIILAMILGALLEYLVPEFAGFPPKVIL